MPGVNVGGAINFVPISAGFGTTVLVAPVANARVRVFSYEMMSQTGGTPFSIFFRSSGGTNLVGQLTGANGRRFFRTSEVGIFETLVGEGLNLAIGFAATGRCEGYLSYVLV